MSMNEGLTVEITFSVTDADSKKRQDVVMRNYELSKVDLVAVEHSLMDMIKGWGFSALDDAQKAELVKAQGKS